MKKPIIASMFLVLLTFGCGNKKEKANSEQANPRTEHEVVDKEIQAIDSIAAEIDRMKKEIDESTEKLDELINNL